MNGLPFALLLSSLPAPPKPPIEIEKPIPEEQPGLKVENFQFEIE